MRGTTTTATGPVASTRTRCPNRARETSNRHRRWTRNSGPHNHQLVRTRPRRQPRSPSRSRRSHLPAHQPARGRRRDNRPHRNRGMGRLRRYQRRIRQHLDGRQQRCRCSQRTLRMARGQATLHRRPRGSRSHGSPNLQPRNRAVPLDRLGVRRKREHVRLPTDPINRFDLAGTDGWGWLTVAVAVLTVASFIPGLDVVAAPLAAIGAGVLALHDGWHCVHNEGCGDFALDVVGFGVGKLAGEGFKLYQAGRGARDFEAAGNLFPKGVRGASSANRRLRSALARASRALAHRRAHIFHVAMNSYNSGLAGFSAYQSWRHRDLW